ncbi:MAG TPA: MFS transporter [Opitutaceae bacterium]|nr:MFS transporter [Opitutaceae bacterium]
MNSKPSFLTIPWQIAWFIFFAAGLNYADRMALASVIPPLRAELGATDGQVGFMFSSFLWAYAVMSPLAGILADRFSRVRIIAWSLAGWSLCTLLMGLAPNVATLCILRIVLGCAESFFLPAAVSLLGEHHGPATRGRAMGLLMTGLNVGIVAGGSFAGFAAEHYGWRTGFWILGGVGVVLAFFSQRFLVEGPVRIRGQEAGSKSEKKGSVRESYAYIFRVPSYYAMLVSAIVAGVASWIFLSWLPLYLAENYKLNLAAAGITGVLLSKGPNLVGVAFGGWVSDKVAKDSARNRVLLKAMSYLLSAPFLFLFLLSPPFAVVAGALVASSLIRSLGAPNEHPIICDIIPRQHRSAAVGLLNTVGTAAGGLGVLLAGLLKSTYGLSTIFGASSMLFILAGGVTLASFLWFMNADVSRARLAEEEPVVT